MKEEKTRQAKKKKHRIRIRAKPKYRVWYFVNRELDCLLNMAAVLAIMANMYNVQNQKKRIV